MNKSKYNKDQAMLWREQGMSYSEISEMMGCSEAWVKKALCGIPKGKNRVAVDGTKLRAVEILKKALAELESL